MALSNGLYEICPYIARGMRVDVAWGSETPGANVLIYGANGGNNQKFYFLEEETDRWSIRSINSGQYVDVYDGRAADGTNVIQWPDHDSANQRWKLTVVGSVELGGVTCDVVTIGTYADGRGTAYLMDVDHALTSNMTNILIWSKNGGNNQKFALKPTKAHDKRLPVPTDFAISDEMYSDVRGAVMPSVGAYAYPSWTCVQSWLDSADNVFESMHALRPIANDGTVEDWREGSAAYSDAQATHGDGLRYWMRLESPLSLAEYDGYKAVDIDLHVRTGTDRAGEQGTSSVTGQDANAVLRLVRVPVLTMDSAKFAPDGLHVGITSDYGGTYTNVLVTDLAADGRHYVTELLPFEGLSNSDSFTIPMEVIGDWLASGTELTISYRLGTEMMYDMGIEHTATLESSYMEGGTLGVTPTVTMGAGRLLRVETAEPLDSVWVVTDHGSYEAHMQDGVAYAPYPFGEDFELVITTRSGSEWGFLHYTAGQTAPLVADSGEPCHAWSWAGGHFLLEHQAKSSIVTSRTVDAQSETYSLDTREWETVSFSPTSRGSFKAQGVLVPGVSEETIDELLALEAAHHVTYRAPSGEIATVGITQVSYDTSSMYSKVTVTMTQETV